MRNAFAQAITELSYKNSNIVLLSGDIGNRLFNPYKEKNSGRFYNCGVAEAGMTGIAAGLATCGLQPVTYTITPFNTLRCLEQIKNDICYPNLPVIIVGTGSGLSYANLGPTHQSMDDIGVMRLLPNMQIICPGDAIEVKLALAEALKEKKPAYIRLGKKNEPLAHKTPPQFEIGKAITLQDGKDLALLGIGNMLPTTIEISKILQKKGVYPKVVSLHTIKPLDEILLNELFQKYATIAVLEEHNIAGGAGSAILEWGSAHRMDTKKVICFGGPDRFLTACGNQMQARESIGLTPENISSVLQEEIGG